MGRELRDDEITVLEGWAGDEYGIPVESTDEAMRLTGRLEGVILDPVYEGKSMAGLIDLVSSGEIPATRTCSTPTSAASPRSTRTAAATTEPSRAWRHHGRGADGAPRGSEGCMARRRVPVLACASAACRGACSTLDDGNEAT